jgi:hypothetical protein
MHCCAEFSSIAAIPSCAVNREIAMLEAYFDESGTHQGSPVLCVAGYVFEKDNARKLSAEWAHMLEEYGLKYFHMKECAPCRENFSHLNMDQCDAVARHAYGLIKQYMTVGYAVTVATNYFHLIPNFGLFSSPYTFGCWQVLMAIRNWSNTVGFFGKISYFFEAGHPSQAESDSIMAALVRNLYLEKAYRYEKWLGLFEQHFPKDKWTPSRVNVHGNAHGS